MSFARNDRSDRRRRVIREAVASDSELAVESVRARKRQRSTNLLDQDESIIPIRRDPGYSQAVRRACQQRLVQLIPVRRSSLSFVLLAAWSIWGLLLLSHYMIHVRPLSMTAGGSLQLDSGVSAAATLPISYLLHVRSSYGIAHWLGGQLWMLTALSALMIFQLKRHKLDDYRAKYRVWMMLSIAALFSSMDASTSALLLFGKSIDSWALREVGYSGWSLVLASFATVVGILGLRLCGELKSAPFSLLFWLSGLLSWALSALVGTGLLKTDWSQAQTDLIVGGAWLGGILSVFLASGIYLRHIYIEAQRRFMMRQGMIKEGKKWKLPNLKLGKKQNAVEKPQSVESSNGKVVNKFAVDSEDEVDTKQRRKLLSPWKIPSMGLPKWKSDPRLGPDYSDVESDVRVRDKGFSEPMAKKPGWFSKRNPDAEMANPKSSKSPERAVSSTPASASARSSDLPDFNEVGEQPKRWWPLGRKKSSSKESNKESKSSTSKTAALDSKVSSSPASQGRVVEKASSPAQPKKSWGLLPRRKATESASLGTKTPQPSEIEKAQPATSQRTDKPVKTDARRWFGLLDGLKLKPPADPATRATAIKSSSATVTSKPIGPPSSSSAARHDSAATAKPSTPIQVNRTPTYETEDDEDEDQSNRGLSRADRKRLKKQQQDNNRRAA